MAKSFDQLNRHRGLDDLVMVLDGVRAHADGYEAYHKGFGHSVSNLEGFRFLDFGENDDESL
jgi:hypothetical protein